MNPKAKLEPNEESFQMTVMQLCKNNNGLPNQTDTFILEARQTFVPFRQRFQK